MADYFCNTCNKCEHRWQSQDYLTQCPECDAQDYTGFRTTYDGFQQVPWTHCMWIPKQIKIALLRAEIDRLKGSPITEAQRQQLRHRGYRI